MGKQIETQETALKDVRLKLRNAIEQALADDLRTKVNTSIQGLVAKEVKERVRQQVSDASECQNYINVAIAQRTNPREFAAASSRSYTSASRGSNELA